MGINIATVAAEVLYIPRGYLHEAATSTEASLHITLTVSGNSQWGRFRWRFKLSDTRAMSKAVHIQGWHLLAGFCQIQTFRVGLCEKLVAAKLIPTWRLPSRSQVLDLYGGMNSRWSSAKRPS